MELNTILGLSLVAYVLFQLITKIGKTLPIIDIMFALAGLQWIVGPYFDYVTDSTHQKYYMYVSESEYMSVIVPLFLAFILPYYILNKYYKQPLNLDIEDLNNVAIVLILIGFLSNILGRLLPSSLAFVFFLLGNLIYVGTGIILIKKDKRYNIVAFLSIFWLFYTSVKTGYFHNFILWSIFFLLIWSIKIKIKRIYILLIFVAGFLGASVIQVIKKDFREQLKYSNNPITLFLDMSMNVLLNREIALTEEKTNDLNVRLNQGWIISAIIDNVPKNEPFAKGETIKNALTSSFIPRFINKDKSVANFRNNFRRFTGLYMRDDTSMAISIVGEAYANFGKKGGFIFMLVWGFILVLFWNILISIQYRNPIVLFFIPLIFLQVIKAESDMEIVLNHLVKASILSFGVIWMINNLLNIQKQA